MQANYLVFIIHYLYGMKKLLLLVFIFCFLFVNGQTWKWGKLEPIPSDPSPYYLDHIIASDNSGNIYFTNDYNSTPNLVRFDQNGVLKWDIQASYCNGCSSSAVATYSGTAYLGGVFSFPFMVFGTDTIRNNAINLFIAKFDSIGLLKWIVPTTNRNIAAKVQTIATDRAGNVYATGWFYGSLGTFRIGNDSTKGSLNKMPFLMKFDMNGNPKWMRAGKSVIDSDIGIVNSLTVDNTGNVYITGAYNGTVVFGSDTLQYFVNNNLAGPFNAFLVKYDSAGNVAWVWNSPINSGKGSSTGVGLGVDQYDNVYLSGSFTSGTFTIGSQTFGPVTQITPYYSKFNSSGSVSWAKEVMELDTNIWGAVSLASDTLNNGYMLINCSSGDGSYALKLGTDTFKLKTSSRTADLLVEFDSSGKVKCGTMFTEGDEDDGDDINVSQSGQYVYLTGDIVDTCIFGPDTISGREAFFIASWLPCNPTIETGTKEILSNSNLTIFPNPSKGIFTIQSSAVSSQLSVEVYNIMGEKVFKETLRSAQGDNLINLSSEPSGIYFYRVSNEDGSLVGEGKVIVQK